MDPAPMLGDLAAYAIHAAAIQSRNFTSSVREMLTAIRSPGQGGCQSSLTLPPISVLTGAGPAAILREFL
jgi:hypothetical protein